MKSYWEIIKQQKRPIKFLLSRVLMRTHLSSLFIISQKEFRLRFYPTSLSAALWIDPDERHEDTEFFRLYLREGDMVVDVGANIGSLSIAASYMVGIEGNVIAIEPHPKIHQYLKRNVELNNRNNVQVFNFALGDEVGQAYFSSQSSDDQNSVSTSEQGILVPLTTIDHLCEHLPYISLLKIDVEGYELAVLRGAKRVLSKTECVYFESWEAHLNKYQATTSQVINEFNNLGFEVYKISRNRHLTKVCSDYVSKQCENLIAVRLLEQFIERTGLCIQ
jgi:FkbM family methyltransferase